MSTIQYCIVFDMDFYYLPSTVTLMVFLNVFSVIRGLRLSRLSGLFSVFRIRMDLGFFADPDLGVNSPDPSINKLMGSK